MRVYCYACFAMHMCMSRAPDTFICHVRRRVATRELLHHTITRQMDIKVKVLVQGVFGPLYWFPRAPLHSHTGI